MAKLTLSVPEASVRQAKRYARQNKTTVSALVDRFFCTLGSQDSKKTPLTESLVGIAKLPDGMSEKDVLAEAIMEKYID
jgi:hypothetical protein